jgi:hypothetical protein
MRKISSILVFAVLIMAILSAGTGIAGAHQSPATCKDVGLGISINEGPNSTYHALDTINYVVAVSLSKAIDCDVSNLTIILTKPDGTNTVVTGVNLNQSQNIKELGPFPYTIQQGEKIVTAKAAASSAEAHSVVKHQNVTATTEISAMVIHPNIAMTEACTPPTQIAPGTINWKDNATNTGDTPLDVKVADSRHGSIFTGSLLPGAFNAAAFTDTGLPAGSYTNVVTAVGTDMLGKQLSASASATCVVTSPPSGKNKVVGNGRTATGAYVVWVYSGFLPNGVVEFNDAINNTAIKATRIDSINTDKTVVPMTGRITGNATINGVGDHAFVLNVNDNGNPPAASDDSFVIKVPDIGYVGGGKALSGNIEVIY